VRASKSVGCMKLGEWAVLLLTCCRNKYSRVAACGIVCSCICRVPSAACTAGRLTTIITTCRTAAV
jgi:hypothetical protein